MIVESPEKRRRGIGNERGEKVSSVLVRKVSEELQKESGS